MTSNRSFTSPILREPLGKAIRLDQCHDMLFSGPKGQSAVISSATIGNVALVETNRPSASANSSNLTEKAYGVKNASLIWPILQWKQLKLCNLRACFQFNAKLHMVT